MKNIFLLIMILVLSACNGKDGGSSTEVIELDTRLFEGSGSWVNEYYYGSTPYRETLTFTGDEAQYRIERAPSGTYVIQSDRRLVLVATGKARLAATSVETTPQNWTWNYSFSGSKLNVCDDDDLCSEFSKVP